MAGCLNLYPSRRHIVSMCAQMNVCGNISRFICSLFLYSFVHAYKHKCERARTETKIHRENKTVRLQVMLRMPV